MIGCSGLLRNLKNFPVVQQERRVLECAPQMRVIFALVLQMIRISILPPLQDRQNVAKIQSLYWRSNGVKRLGALEQRHGA